MCHPAGWGFVVPSAHDSDERHQHDERVSTSHGRDPV